MVKTGLESKSLRFWIRTIVLRIIAGDERAGLSKTEQGEGLKTVVNKV
jgi:hypothetical protein